MALSKKLASLFGHPSARGHSQTEQMFGGCLASPVPSLNSSLFQPSQLWHLGCFSSEPGGNMRCWKFLALPALTVALLSIPSSAPAQVSVNIGTEPVCPYGYYDFAPYDCAPYGYYGPEWFTGGVFIGAGPWVHGPHGFFGHAHNHI